MKLLLNLFFIISVICTFAEAVKGERMYSPIECARDCVDGELPRICYYNFTLEEYAVQGLACKLCTPTVTNQFLANCECVMADGIERVIYTVNRMLPGPSIQACQHDKIVIDVKNKLPGMETTIHWHGIFQNGTQYYDGVPMVSQCGIHEGETFRYQWLANSGGTYYWHSHAGLQRANGIYGNLVIRQPKSRDIHGALYDHDLVSHVIVISDWYHHLLEDRFPGLLNNPGQTAKNLLINGKGIFINLKNKEETKTPVEIFEVEHGQRYRFRIINAMSSVCPSVFTIEGHNLTLIATDAEPIEPVEVGSINSASGERYDFVLNANREKKSYWIHVKGLEECKDTKAQQFAILQYKGSDHDSLSKRPSYKKGLPHGVVVNAYHAKCGPDSKDKICISQLSSAKKVEKQLLPSEKPDMQIYLPIMNNKMPLKTFLPSSPYTPYLIPPPSKAFGSVIHNITFASPPSPLLSQYDDIDQEQLCNATHRPAKCKGKIVCHCTHVINIPLNTMVEIVLVDEDPKTLNHPFHLHGYAYSVLAVGNGHDINTTRLSSDMVMKADAEGRLVRKFDNPPFKDTVMVPAGGYAIIRFRANNPGFWLFHCHFEIHGATGMKLVLHVGQPSDLPPIPEGFPKCGNFKPAILSDMTKVN